jgi:hypothetical protein
MVPLRAVALWIPGATGRAYSPDCVEEEFSEGPRLVETANTHEVLSPTGDTPPNVAINAARKRGKRLRLATNELPENSRGYPLCGLSPIEAG